MKRSKLQENEFRALVRAEIARVISEEETEQSPETEPEQTPEQDRTQTLTKITTAFIRTLRNNLQDVSVEEMIGAMDSMMDRLGYDKGTKLRVLRGLKGKLGL